MPMTPVYKGYKGWVKFDRETNTWYGRVFGIRDVVTFKGDTCHESWQAFRDSVDEYLSMLDDK